VLPPGGADAGKVAIRAAVDAVLANTFGDGVSDEKKWVRARNSIVITALEVALTKLAKFGATQNHINRLRQEIGGLIDDLLTAEELGKRLEEVLMEV
jgi:hypothetical protein